MTLFALALVVTSAFVHASWNYLLKRSGGGTGLIALASLLSLVLYLPIVVAAAWLQDYQFHPMHVALMLGSGMVHTVYFLLLDRAYRSGGDLSIVYPLARATGPLLSIVVAILLLGERPGPTALAGAVLIGASALLLTGNPFARHKRGSPLQRGDHDPRLAVGFALLTGMTIAIYTVFDKYSVAVWLIVPLVYDWGCNASRCLVLVPFARRRAPGEMARAWREQRRTALAIAILSPLSYILMLTAMVFTPVSLIAPAREVSILFAAIIGAHFLQEGAVRRRLVAAAGMVLGIAGLAFG